jgi:hypothetical protein
MAHFQLVGFKPVAQLFYSLAPVAHFNRFTNEQSQRRCNAQRVYYDDFSVGVFFFHCLAGALRE